VLRRRHVDRVVHRVDGCLGRGHGRLDLFLAAHVRRPSHGRPFERAIAICSGCRRAGRHLVVDCVIGYGDRWVRRLARGCGLLVARGGCLARGSDRVGAQYPTLWCDGKCAGDDYESLCNCVPRYMTLAGPNSRIGKVRVKCRLQAHAPGCLPMLASRLQASLTISHVVARQTRHGRHHCIILIEYSIRVVALRRAREEYCNMQNKQNHLPTPFRDHRHAFRYAIHAGYTHPVQQ
jgi:hypothetical protein